jgi:2-methylcitrate dehydratase PrpD
MSLARKISQSALRLRYEQLAPEVVEKVKVCLFDFLSAAYESLDLPWSQQSMKVVGRGQGTANVIGTSMRVPVADAAFVNAILGHGLVREDMHTGSVSHIGVVVMPTLLALAQEKEANGKDFIAAAVCGYEVSGSLGRALMSQENVRQYRPTGICGPPGASVAGARMLGLSEDAMTSALAFGANTTVGLNEWPFSGGDEMFFHVGFVARNAVTAVQLSELGARASETSLDGEAGLFRALRRQDQVASVAPFSGDGFEIMQVFHKPAPACNYAQTAAQAALQLVTEDKVRSGDVESIVVKSTAAAIGYPGCNHAGPFEKTLQAKMSIHYCVAATLANGAIQESNYRKLADPEINRLAGVTALELDQELTASYPKIQGSEVILKLKNGKTVSRRLQDVIPATPEQIRARFREAAGRVLGDSTVREIESAIDKLESAGDVGILTGLLATVPQNATV